MPNQNWVLAAQVHIPYSSPTSAVSFLNLNSQTATDDTGQNRTLTAGQAPVYRMFARYTIHTSATLSNSHAYSYIYTTGQHDYAQEWCGPNQIGSLYSSSFGTGSSTAGYYSTGSYFGNGAMKNDYGNYAWGSQITDAAGQTVEPYDRRRRCVNIGCWEFYSTEQFYPVHQHWTICCTDGNSDGSSSTFNNEWGAYEIGCGGQNSTYSTNEFYFQMAYNFSGTFLFYRSCNGNFQVNE